jgi:ABC-type phosphate transport system substrate-binding protein
VITRPGRSRHPGGLRFSMLWGRPARVALVSALTALTLLLAHGVANASASGYVTVEGSGSSWAYIAISQWINDVEPQGMTVNYNPDGSAEGRTDYMQGSLVDFAGSDPPFNTGEDKLGGEQAQDPSDGYDYVPDTAGGTAFMYHLNVGGHLIRNLRLNAKVLMEIFTGAITNWDDPRISAIYGGHLPNIPITPVLRSDGSGATYFFTEWISTLFPTQWNDFCEHVHPGITLPCGNTEFYPSNWGNAKSEDGSNNVADYITSPDGQGAIGYDEYAYALNSGYPVVQVLNPAGYFVGPTASNVAIALLKAQIDYNKNSNMYLQQNLNDVYTDTDRRAYPLSSYSYLIVPKSGTSLPSLFGSSPGAGRTLSAFINYFLCAGQKQMPNLGYSPLPYNLVEGGFLQVNRIPDHVSTPAMNHYGDCQNPTFENGKNELVDTAAYPTACQKLGAPLNCVVGRNGKPETSNGSGNGSGSNGSGKNGSGSNGSSGNPATGGSSGDPGSTNAQTDVSGQVVNLSGNGTDRALLAVITALAVIMAVATPPTVSAWMRRRKRQAGA